MMTTRRGFLGRAGAAAGLGGLSAAWSPALAQDDAAVTARLARDLEIHASFGLKAAGSRGELSTFTDMGFDSAFACIGLHRWFHTIGDTIECVDAGLLLPVVRAHQATLARLVGAGP